MTPELRPEQINAASRISGLVLINAMIFQEVLSEHDDRVLALSRVLDDTNPPEKFRDHWNFIMEKINYHPIFHVARELLLDLSATQDVLKALRTLAHAALSIVGKRAALRHDLMGRVYHRLLAQPKYLGTYYTSIPAADLLLKLALRPDRWPVAWHDLDAVRQFRIADLACGTGTLLMAAADTVMDNYVAASSSRGRQIDLGELHKAIAEEMLYGYDVLVSALHLTASTLALKAPDVVFNSMNLFSLPLGGPDHRLGSIDFLGSEAVGVSLMLFGGPGSTRRVKGQAADEEAIARPPGMDLCVMNPPFTRSVGGNLLFGSASPKERTEMQKQLKKLVKQSHAFASITAGLGSVFVAVADRYIKPGGRIALVLPKAVLSGVAWDRTRELLRGKYKLEYIVASHDPTRWNFSESTDLSEVLLVAAKVSNSNSRSADEPVVGLNLWRNPTTSFDALAVANELLRSAPPDLEKGQGAADVGVGDAKVGEAVSIPWSALKEQYLWLLPCAFAQSDLIRAAYYLLRNRVWIPGSRSLTPIPLSPLSHLGSLGPDARDMHDAFATAETKTAYAAFWGHHAGSVRTIAQTPNRYLSPLPTAKEGRHLRKVEDLWPLAGELLLAERLRLNTQRLAAVRTSKSVLSNVWWPLSLAESRKKDQYGKSLALWLNSTAALLLLLSHRQETEGPWVKFKKPVLGRLPVLDVRLLSADQRRQLASAYDNIAEDALQPFPEMARDPVRAGIDEAIAKILDLPDLTILRELLAQEPIICLKRL